MKVRSVLLLAGLVVAVSLACPVGFTEAFDPPFDKGTVVKGPEGVQHEQLRFWEWPDDTILDLRQSTYYALEGGPFNADNLPEIFPANGTPELGPELGNAPKYPVSIKGRGSKNILVLGGRVIGQQPRELTWRVMKALYDGDGIRIEASGRLVVDGIYIENVEDGYSPRGDGHWTLRNSYMKYIRDDFVENDGLLSGEIENCLADSAFVFLSNRPGKNADPGRLAALKPPHVRISNTLVRLTPMPYDGAVGQSKHRRMVDGKANGMFFKWSRWGGTVDMSDCILRMDQISTTGPSSMKFPEGAYKNVTLIWLGEGNYAAEVPEGVTVTRDTGIWDKARAKWLREHADLVRD